MISNDNDDAPTGRVNDMSAEKYMSPGMTAGIGVTFIPVIEAGEFTLLSAKPKISLEMLKLGLTYSATCHNRTSLGPTFVISDTLALDNWTSFNRNIYM